MKTRLNLRLFDGEGAAPAAEGMPAAGAAAKKNPLASVCYEKQPESEAEEKPPETYGHRRERAVPCGGV